VSGLGHGKLPTYNYMAGMLGKIIRLAQSLGGGGVKFLVLCGGCVQLGLYIRYVWIEYLPS
jgi:hypothetical protein